MNEYKIGNLGSISSYITGSFHHPNQISKREWNDSKHENSATWGASLVPFLTRISISRQKIKRRAYHIIQAKVHYIYIYASCMYKDHTA